MSSNGHMKKQKTRVYQQEAIDASWRKLKRDRSTLVVMPTGSGKTHVIAMLAQRFWRSQKKRILILADRQILVRQAKEMISEQTDLTCSVEMGSEFAHLHETQVVCGSVQSITKRLDKFSRNTFGLIAIDEADLAMAKSYQRILEHFNRAKLFGCTATPNRHDGISLSEVFKSVAYQIDLGELVRRKFLVPVRRRNIKVLDLSRIRDNDGDFDPKQLDKILTEEKHLHEVAKPTLERAGDRPTVAFCVSINHSEKLAAVMNRYRPGCAQAVHSKSKNRDEILADFRAGKFQFLCNCALINRGVDIPKIACIAMARPTKSLTLYTQSLGRGTRIWEDKVNLLVLDFTANSEMHDLVNAIDALAGKHSEEEKERAKEIADEEDEEKDVTDLLDRAARELAGDEEMRKRVRAKVRFREEEIKKVDWSKWRHLLGTMYDKDVAKKIRCSECVVANARRKFKISAFRKFMDWSKWKHLFGTISDSDLAKKIGRTSTRVSSERRKNGIKAFKPVIKINWNDFDHLLGTMADRQAAKKIGCNVTSVIARRKILERQAKFRTGGAGIAWNKWKHLFGTMSDNELANKIGCSANTVFRVRNMAGIPSWRKLPPRKIVNSIDWSKWEHLFCIMSNRKLAEKIGCSVWLIKKRKMDQRL